MTLIEAINRTDNNKPNSYSIEQKIEWISRLDGRIVKSIVNTHEDGKDTKFEPYTDADMNKELIVPFPYDDIYEQWLETRIDLANNEYDRYNISTIVFNETYREFESAYNREHKPISRQFKFF